MSRKRIPLETWENVDWSQTPTQIARALGVAVNTVTRQRARRAPEMSRRYVDWPDDLGEVPDVDIATRLGVTRQAVQWARRNRGIPAPSTPHIGRERVLVALVRRALGQTSVGDDDVLWRFLRFAGRPVKITHRNRCPHCRRYFTTPQGLGLHFKHARRNPKVCKS